MSHACSGSGLLRLEVSAVETQNTLASMRRCPVNCGAFLTLPQAGQWYWCSRIMYPCQTFHLRRTPQVNVVVRVVGRRLTGSAQDAAWKQNSLTRTIGAIVRWRQRCKPCVKNVAKLSQSAPACKLHTKYTLHRSWVFCAPQLRQSFHFV